jgi:hypothetical protein
MLLLRALSLVTLIRLGLWVIPFNPLYRFLGRFFRTQELTDCSPDRLAWAVHASARRIPCASCLTRALALQLLLGRAGQQSSIQIGIAKDKNGKFEAHAWIEWGGRILLNTPAEIDGYSRLTSLEWSAR